MTRSFACLAFLVLSTSYAVGCGDDVGPCNDPDEGRDTVLAMGKIQYAGQAILNASCSKGCHSSTAKGDARQGAPAGLDFDLQPIMESEALGEKSTSDKIVVLSDEQLEGLRKRQDIVYQNRDLIWQQVRDGLMPPDGPFEQFTQFAKDTLFQSADDEPCERGKAIKTLGSQQQVLRNWLACGAPIVESAGSVIRVGPVPGVVGFQYPMCSDAPTPLVPKGTKITLESLLKANLVTCTSCHPTFSKPNLATFDAAKATLMSTAKVCGDKPYITPGKPEKSFLFDSITKEKPGCGTSRMPWLSAPLSKAQIAQVEQWIKDGAPMGSPSTETPMEEPTETDEGPIEETPEPSEEDAGDVEEQPDAAVEAPRDAGRDAGRDAAVDAGRDAGRGSLFPFPFP